jgi:hypothetical protein
VEIAMRALRIASGVSVLFTSLAYGHLLHHHAVHAGPSDFHNPIFAVSYAVAVVAGVLAVIGGILLLKR